MKLLRPAGHRHVPCTAAVHNVRRLLLPIRLTSTCQRSTRSARSR